MHGDDRKLSYLTQEMEIQGLFRFGLDNLYLIGVQDIHVYLSHNSYLEMTDRKLSYLSQKTGNENPGVNRKYTCL